MPSPFDLAQPQADASGWDILTATATAAGVLATVAAVLTALWLARRDEKTRHSERNARSIAQARLVRLDDPTVWTIGAIEDSEDPAFKGLSPVGHDYKTRFRFVLGVLNASDRPIMCLALQLWIDDFEKPVATHRHPLLLAGERATLTVRAAHDQGPVAVRVSWIDSNGRCWYKEVLQTHDDPQEPVEGSGRSPQQFRDYWSHPGKAGRTKG